MPRIPSWNLTSFLQMMILCHTSLCNALKFDPNPPFLLTKWYVWCEKHSKRSDDHKEYVQQIIQNFLQIFKDAKAKHLTPVPEGYQKHVQNHVQGNQKEEVMMI